jgi:hypothetical protein
MYKRIKSLLLRFGLFVTVGLNLGMARDNDPLLDSGLIGPVTIHSSVEVPMVLTRP